ncbi:hypothetical protein CHS0354_024153 [Potamilus streckersoni]|uniref:BIG2 domain-containing protein n=1 Tax=Potamilus streckersoni TaxID=2493646 RepID=A0AAE0VLS3_9BIVA|nr:hypothetical protein CHS0354_024153 [Potamilus streckersoni]
MKTTKLFGKTGTENGQSKRYLTPFLVPLLFLSVFASGCEEPTLTNLVTVKFITDGGSSIPDQTINIGETVMMPENPKKVTVTFNTNGGSAIDDQTIVSGEKAVMPINPTKSGYTFAGWYKDATLINVFNFATETITEHVTLYAKWNKNSFNQVTVTFNTNGGSAIDDQTIVSGEKAVMPINPTSSGYTFAGWYRDATLTNAFDFNTPITANITLYAKWKQNPFNQVTVTFNTNGGSAIISQIITIGGKAVMPSNPTKSGYTFAGWYRDATLINAFDFNTPITAHITLYAKWTQNPPNQFTVTFNTNGGNAIVDQTITSGEKATAPSNPTRSGYTFVGWYRDVTLTNAFDFNTPITAHITLYAKWTINTYTVTFNSNSGSFVPNVTVNHGEKATKPADPTLANYTFVGWYRDATLTNVFDFNTPITANITLYAKWTINTYTVTFNSNSGSFVPNVTVNHGEKATKPADPTLANYTFAGWYRDATLINAFDFKTPITAHITLYAKWTINTYTVTFNSNSGSFVPNVTVNHGEKATKPADPTLANYTFVGWYRDATLTNVFDFKTPITANITLYAKWTINTYTVTFNSNSGSFVPNVTVNHGEKATKPADPTLANYTFVGWYRDATLTNVFDFNTPITANITLYAKWTINTYTVTFNSNGGNAIVDQIITSGGKAVKPSNPTLANYIFAGWYRDVTLTNVFDFNTPITAHITLYARWTTLLVILDKTTHTTLLGKTTQMKATILPENAPQGLTWTSSNTAVATVSATGLITPVSAGTVNIIATSTAENSESATVAVTVRNYFYIPDENFRNKLMSINAAWFSVIDGVHGLNIGAVSGFGGVLDVNSSSIVNLQGIEYFTSLTKLHCSDNQLRTLDVSKNVNLTDLRCSYNQLTSLDVIQNVNLVVLNCNNNQLTTLDASRSVNLRWLNCFNNQLTSLDVSQNVNLWSLYCHNNQLKTLYVGKNVILTHLDCNNNQLTTLDVSGTVNLRSLYCNNNQLQTLDVSGTVNLTWLSCYNNQLQTLDVSGAVNLTWLSCYNNQLQTLDVGKNVNLTTLLCYSNYLKSLDMRGMRLVNYLYITTAGNNGGNSNRGITSIKVHSDVATHQELKNAKNAISGLQIDTYTDASGSTTYTQAICDFDPRTGARASTARACTP